MGASSEGQTGSPATLAGANKRVLVIAGSDSSGGAGLEADQKVIAAHGCYALTATTALTAQNTTGVSDIHEVPPAFTRKQIDAVFADMPPSVVKTGMLATAATIEMVAQAVADYKIDKLVLDPVMVATTGAQLLPSEAASELRALLLPRTLLLTPNIPEAQLLLSSAAAPGEEHREGVGPVEVRRVEDLEEMARRVRRLGPRWVLIKGGHAPFRRDGSVAASEAEREIMVDVLLGPGGGDGEGEGEAPAPVLLRIESAYQDSRNTHGTGCSLASAIASNLALGLDPPAAVRGACRYVEAGIRTAPGYGRGNGPLNHFHSTYTLPFAPGRFLEYLLGRADVLPAWERFCHHPFVRGLGSGKLPLESFKGYLVQDYLYLVHFARANALASYKAKTMEDVAAGAKIVTHIHTEMALHIGYCKSFGLDKEEIENTEELQACTAYTRYVLDVGQSGDWLGLQLALAPCLLGYGAVAKRLHADPATDRSGANVYWPWIQNYVADDYVQAVTTGSALIERHAMQQSPTRIEELVKIFIHATKMEIGFWEMFPAE